MGRFAGMALAMVNSTKEAPLTTVIIATTCLSFCAQFLHPWLTFAWLHDMELMRRGQGYYRYLTANLLHADTEHLFNNMFSLWGMGTAVEGAMGPVLYALLYAFSGLTGNLLTQHFGSYRYSLGASGAVAGVLGALAVLHVRCAHLTTKAYAWKEFKNFKGIVASIFGSICLILPAARGQKDGMGHMAHLGGVIGGVVFTWLCGPRCLALVSHICHAADHEWRIAITHHTNVGVSAAA